MDISYLRNRDFLRALDNESNKFYWVKIEVLDQNENPIQNIEGRVQPGSTINIDGNSSVRRTCNISFVAEEKENDLTNIENLLSINKKVRIYEGIKNNINKYYNDIIWFPLGVFVIVQPTINHSSNGCIIGLSCKDKMCLLNGECAGSFPTSITFDSYDQIIGSQEINKNPLKENLGDNFKPNNYTVYIYQDDKQLYHYYIWSKESSWEEVPNASLVGQSISIKQRIFDIIQSVVHFYGGESISKIYINDIPLEIKNVLRYVGTGALYYNSATGVYTMDSTQIDPNSTTWKTFEYNDEIGYTYTDFVYPGNLISNIGDNICSILDKIKNTLGNYEYFYDINGNFIFQEKRNYLNTSYEATNGHQLNECRDSNGCKLELASNELSVINGNNYVVDFYAESSSVYSFDEGNGLLISVSNSPNYNNIKNDFHIWGDEKYPIHYHLVIKRKPPIKGYDSKSGLPYYGGPYDVMYVKNSEDEYTGGIRLATLKDPDNSIDRNKNYYSMDWRAELYIQGLLEWRDGQRRPDIYKQELLDLFDSIYNFKEKKFKTDLVTKPNVLKYFFDYLEPANELSDCSVDVIGTKMYSYKQSKMNRLYNTDIPDNIIISIGMDNKYTQSLIDKCLENGQHYSNVNPNLYSKLAENSSGYTAQEVSRDLLYQYTTYNETISLQSVPIYYLDVNTRITVQDRASGIYGDYIIKSISIPLGAESTMNISATRAYERI